MEPHQKTKGTEPQLLSGAVGEKSVKPALGSPHDGYAAALLTLSTLTMAPAQLILSKDPNRDSELTA